MSFLRGLAHALRVRASGAATSRALEWETLFMQAARSASAGRIEEAERSLRSALAIAERFEAADPRLTATLEQLASLVTEAGRCEEAVPLLERSLAAKEASWGSASSKLSGTLIDLARALDGAGRPADAERCRSRARRLLEARIGPDLPELRDALDASPGLREDEKP